MIGWSIHLPLSLISWVLPFRQRTKRSLFHEHSWPFHILPLKLISIPHTIFSPFEWFKYNQSYEEKVASKYQFPSCTRSYSHEANTDVLRRTCSVPSFEFPAGLRPLLRRAVNLIRGGAASSPRPSDAKRCLWVSSEPNYTIVILAWPCRSEPRVCTWAKWDPRIPLPPILGAYAAFAPFLYIYIYIT